MIDEKVDRLEKSMVELESALSSLAETFSKEIGNLATSMGKMTDAIIDLAVIDNKVKRLETDIQSLANMQREDTSNLYGRVNNLESNIKDMSEEHHSSCNIKISELDDELDGKGKDRLKFGLFLTFGSMTFVWGVTTLIFWALFHGEQTQREKYALTIKDTNFIVKENQLLLREHEGKFDVIDEKLKKAVAQRYKIAEDN